MQDFIMKHKAWFITICALVLLAIAIIISNIIYLAGQDQAAGNRPMVTISAQPVKTLTPKATVKHHTKPMITFITTGDVATITCTIEGDDKGCLPDSHSSYPLSKDRMASYSIIAQQHNQPGDSTTVSIKIGGKVLGSITATPAHQIAAITVYRLHPHGKWIVTPSFG